MVHGVVGPHNTAHRFGQRTVEVGFRVVGQQAVHQKGLNGNIRVLGGPSAVLVGISRSLLGALIVVGGLDEDTYYMNTKAVRIHGKMDLRLEEISLPEVGPDDVRVKIISDSVCMPAEPACRPP